MLSSDRGPNDLDTARRPPPLPPLASGVLELRPRHTGQPRTPTPVARSLADRLELRTRAGTFGAALAVLAVIALYALVAARLALPVSY